MTRESKTVPPPELKTNLDPLFEIRDPDLYERYTDDLTIIAAQINAFNFFTIGPENRSVNPTVFEEMRDEREVDGRHPMQLVRIDVGQYGRDIKKDYKPNRDTGTCPELKMAEVLTLIADYNLAMARDLVGPLARELLITRVVWSPDNQHEVYLRRKDEVEESIERLGTFAHDLNEVEARLYKALADQTELEFTRFRNESKDIVKQVAESRRREHLKWARPRRYLARLAGVGFLGLGAWSLTWNLVENSQYSNKAIAQVLNAKGVAGELTDLTDGLDVLRSSVAENQADEVAIDRAEQLAIEYKVGQLESIQLESGSTEAEQQILAETQRLIDQTIEVASDGDISSEESDVLNDIEDKITQAIELDSGSNIKPNHIFAGFFGLASIGTLYSSLRYGGRRDEKLKVYNEGVVTKADSTDSPTVNVLYGLKQNAA